MGFRPMNVIGYVRVSTLEQADDGNGLDIQRLAIEEVCAANDWAVTVFADAGVSGACDLARRPGLAQALSSLESRAAECLIVYRLDRLARDLVLQETLITRLNDLGVGVRSVSEPDLDILSVDPTKILIRQVLGAVGQYERALIRGRMEAGRALKAAAGGYVGGQPRYGQRAQAGLLVRSEEEEKVVMIVRQMRSRGLSYRTIARVLEEEGLHPRRARHWHPMVVRSIDLRASD